MSLKIKRKAKARRRVRKSNRRMVKGIRQVKRMKAMNMRMRTRTVMTKIQMTT